MRNLLRFLLVCSLQVAPFLGPVAVRAAPVSDTAEEILLRMTPEERIGQLFLVTFRGSSVEPDSPIARLIRRHHVAGVILEVGNDNFAPSPGTAEAVSELTDQLQDLEYEGSLEDTVTRPGAAEPVNATYVPLLIGVSDHDGGVSIGRILAGMSHSASQMAVGAAWDADQARAVGEVLGRELEAMGINMLLGPSLDVLGEPGQPGPGDLGVRTFGGDPYWVSEMGKGYVAGIHEGALGRIAVIAKHFPGHGGSDRPLAEEVSTVRKSLDQLMQIELPPFFAVTGAAPGSDAAIADGLLTSHIRYQGFQGNIRAKTRPISLDPEAYAQLMSLGPLEQWRQAGGVTISDSLGSRAIRRFRDPLERAFDAQLVARDALVAGNDLLFVSNFRDPNDVDAFTTLEKTLAFFAQKYREDPVFAQRVDEAVLRVLGLKLRLYDGSFLRARVAPSTAGMSALGRGDEVAFRVARRGATLISPSPEEVLDRIGGAPRLGERVVFFTDLRLLQRCSGCSPEPLIGVRALEERIVSLYGPGAAGQVGGWNLQSFTLADLTNFLGQPPRAQTPAPLVAPEEVEGAVATADWLVFSILNVGDGTYGADALPLLLELRPDIAQDKRVVVFAFDVPYGLDATNVSNLDVFYALYASSPPFVDVAARLLFQEISAPGAPPVSVPGVGYDLLNALKPDPAQVITIELAGEVGEQTPTPEAVGFRQGAVVSLRTGVIMDTNGHPVPDDTPVEFIVYHQGENITQTVESTTADGVATMSFRLDRLGLYTVQARSDPALRSDVVQLNVQEGVPAFPTVIAPTPLPTNTPPPTDTPELNTPTPNTETDQGGEAEPRPVSRPRPADLILGLVGLGMVAGGGYYVARLRAEAVARRVRYMLIAAVGSLIGYNYLALGLPGSQQFLNGLGMLAGWAAAVIGGAAALGVAHLGLLLLEAILADGSDGGDDQQDRGS